MKQRSESTMEVPMAQPTPELPREQWIERLHAWAVECWGSVRAQAIREEIEATAEQLIIVSEYPLTMEQIPAFFSVEM
jgi:hypothetical protein